MNLSVSAGVRARPQYARYRYNGQKLGFSGHSEHKARQTAAKPWLKWPYKLLLAGIGLISLLPKPGLAKGINTQYPGGVPSGAEINCVQRFEDNRFVLRNQQDQMLLDLCANPLFSAETQARLQQTMENFEANTGYPLRLLVTPRSLGESPDLKQLTLSVMKDLGITDPTVTNDILVYFNAEAVEKNDLPQAVFIDAPQPEVVETAVQLLQEHTLPALKVGRVDEAAFKTINALEQLVTTGEAEQAEETSPASQKELLIIGGIAAVYMVLLAAAYARDIQQGDHDLPRTRLMLEIGIRIIFAMARSSGSSSTGRKGGGSWSSGGGGGGGRGGGI